MTAIESGRLLQLRSTILSENMALRRAAGLAGSADTSAVSNPGFARAIGGALDSVSAQQSRASALAESFERGETNDIVAVMVERQKASLGFEATLQVRNKLLSAYRDIMNMPV